MSRPLRPSPFSSPDLPLAHGTLIKRYKRFLADVELDDGTGMTVHCPNSGSMLGMDAPGNRVVVSDSLNDKRKLRHTLELVEVHDGEGPTWVGVHTGRPNQWAEEAVAAGLVDGVPDDAPRRREVKYGEEGRSRIDLLVEPEDAPRVFVEVKNTTLTGRADDGVLEARFPDAVTTRGQKHLRELMAQVDAGDRAMLLFFVNRGDAARFAPAAAIDPDYAELLTAAMDHGVEVVPFQVDHTVEMHDGQPQMHVAVVGDLPVVLQND